jgi:hypothetical protein
MKKKLILLILLLCPINSYTISTNAKNNILASAIATITFCSIANKPVVAKIDILLNKIEKNSDKRGDITIKTSCGLSVLATVSAFLMTKHLLAR